MNVEGLGAVSPIPIKIPLSKIQLDYARKLAEERSHKYGARTDSWGKGYYGAAETIYRGLLGEIAAGIFISRYDIPCKQCLGLLRGGDGYDLLIESGGKSLAIDVKTGALLVRTDMCDKAIYLFSRIVDPGNPQDIELLGWLTNYEVKQARISQGRAWLNHTVDNRKLHRLLELVELARGEIYKGGHGIVRYHGGKGKLLKELRKVLSVSISPDLPLFQNISEYCEPFVGAGAAALYCLRKYNSSIRFRLNDKDSGIAAIWYCLRYYPNKLKHAVIEMEPSPDEFFRIKDSHTTDLVEMAANKIASHQWSALGLGEMAGSVIGGKSQSGDYKIDCRWNINRILVKLSAVAKLLAQREVHLTCLDFESVVKSVAPDGFIYADPPYYVAGPQLYKHSFSESDHLRMAKVFRGLKCRWLISYDDHPAIRELYNGYEIIPINVINSNTRRKNREIFIKNY